MSAIAGGGTTESTASTHIVRTKNCGIAEIHLLSYATSPLHALRLLEPPLKYGITWPYERSPSGEEPVRKNVLFPFVTFTGVVEWAGYKKVTGKEFDNYGQKFADYIAANNLGTIATLPGRVNWTGKTIQIWVWAPDYDKLFAHLDEVRNASK